MANTEFRVRSCWYDNPLLRIGWGYWVQKGLMEVLSDVAAPGSRLAVLDVPCGTAEILCTMALRYPAGRVVGVDVSRSMLNQGIPKVAPLLNAHLISGTAAQLAQPSEVFDVGVICDGLHHFEQPEMAIGEVARVLRPGGTLVVVDPRFDTFLERGFHNSFRWLDKPHRYYRRSEVERLLREAGLEPTTYRNQYLKHYVVGVRAD